MIITKSYTIKTVSALIGVLAVFVLFYSGSNIRSSVKYGIKIDTLETAHIEPVILPIGISSILHGNISTVTTQENKEELIVFANSYTNMLYYYSLAQQKNIDSFSLKLYSSYIKGFSISGVDSVYLSLSDGGNYNKIVLFSKVAGVWKQTRGWDCNALIKTVVDSNSFIASGYRGWQLQVFHDTVVVTLSTSLPGNDSGPNTAFLDGHYDLHMQLLDDDVRLVDTANLYPSYFRHQDYYSNRNRVSLNSRQNIYYYYCTDTVLIHDIELNSVKRCKLPSAFFKMRKPFDYSRKDDIGYIQDYNIENATLSYLATIEPTQNTYWYVKHEGVRIEADRTKNNYFDLPLSLILADHNLNKTKEVFVKAKTIMPSMAFCVNESLYVCAHSDKQTDGKQTLFYKLKF